MRVAVVQADTIWMRPAENRARLAEYFDELDPADLVVLPEVFT